MPFHLPSEGSKVTFVQGLRTVAGSGSPSTRSGVAYYIYACNHSMENQCFYDSDGDMLIGTLLGVIHSCAF